jgi:hypothetical protein
MDPIRSRDFSRNDFDRDELDAMKRNESTNEALNKVRKDAGYMPGGDVKVRGDDKTAKELQAEWKASDGPLTALKHEGPSQAAEHIGTHVAEHAAKHVASKVIAGGAAAAGLGISAGWALYAGLHHLAEQNERAEVLRTAYARDEMYLAMITHVDVPGGFRAQEIAERPDAGRGFQSGTQKMTTAFASQDRALQATLQLHCDQGMNAARDLVDAGVLGAATKADVERELGRRPSIEARYREDPAFRAGFDALVWAKGHGDEYKRTIERLEARDARYAQHGIQYRG